MYVDFLTISYCLVTIIVRNKSFLFQIHRAIYTMTYSWRT